MMHSQVILNDVLRNDVYRYMILSSRQGPPQEFESQTLKPVLNDSEGFYQIGPARTCSDQFVLSVTIAFAANLPQVQLGREVVVVSRIGGLVVVP